MITPDQRARRRELARRRRRLQRICAALALGIAGIVALSLVLGSKGKAPQASAAGAGPNASAAPAHGGRAIAVRRARIATPARLLERRIGTLPAPLEDPGAAVVGTRVVLAGGLTAQDTSTNVVIALHGSSAQARPALPTAQHDAPAAALAGAVYVFGGGDGVRQLDHVLRIDPRSGQVTTVGRLPAASSDSSAATIGSTAYVVGGYTGTRWLEHDRGRPPRWRHSDRRSPPRRAALRGGRRSGQRPS